MVGKELLYLLLKQFLFIVNNKYFVQLEEGKWHHYSINTDAWNEFSAFISRVGKVE